MRALLAALIATTLLLSAAGMHVHADADAQHASHVERCAACVLRVAAAAEDAAPDLRPLAPVVGVVPQGSGAAPVTGAPLGAVPGQSPPCA